MSRCLLVQANGDGIRMRKYFNIPKHQLYYHGIRIIDHIITKAKVVNIDCYIATKHKEHTDYNTIHLHDTKNRIETLASCLDKLAAYETIIVHDCDVLFQAEMIAAMNDDMIAVSHYKGDGMKYGFVELDKDFAYKHGNEKETATPYITAGMYAVNRERIADFIDANKKKDIQSLLEYYNVNKPKLLYTKDYLNLGDIESYMHNL